MQSAIQVLGFTFTFTLLNLISKQLQNIIETVEIIAAKS